jgi:hypothetical protein
MSTSPGLAIEAQRRIVAMATPLTQYHQLLEHVWQVCVSRFARGIAEIVLPLEMRDILGQYGVQIIAERYR